MTHSALPATLPRRRPLWAVAVVVVGIAAYANSLSTPFVFDDMQYVARNSALHHLWPPYDWLAFCLTRPIPYFTFAVNYALGGDDVRGYHLVNIGIHIATALLLFGLVRRTLRLPAVAERYARHADGLAAAIALVWVAHPLTTQSVTYIYQRIESLAALFAVLALYAFARAYGAGGPARRGWAAAAVAACYAAMLSKESVAALPILVLIYDRLFLSHRWRDVLVRRYFHAALFCCWTVMAGLIVATGSAYGKAGIGVVEGCTPWEYLVSQSGVLLHYLRLAFVPTGLCLDYGWQVEENWNRIVPQGLVILGLLAATMVGLVRGRLWSFPACAFFLLLAPTSSIVPIADLAFENRMYLPLAAVVSLTVCGGFELVERRALRVLPQVPATPRVATHRAANSQAAALREAVARETTGRETRTYRGAAAAVAGVVAVLVVLTHLRNRDYESELSLWHDIVAKAPDNPRPYVLIGRYHHQHRRREEARRWYLRSLEITTRFAPTLHRLAILETEERRFAEAERYARMLVDASPDTPLGITRLGHVYLGQGRTAEATVAFGEALTLMPEYVEALEGMAQILLGAGRLDEAAELRRRIAVAEPNDSASFNNLGVVYRLQGRDDDAIAAFRQALAIDPLGVEARANLGSALDRRGEAEAALAELARAVADDGNCLLARVNLGNALARRGRYEEAIGQYSEALRIDPANAQVASYLAQALADQAAETSPRS